MKPMAPCSCMDKPQRRDSNCQSEATRKGGQAALLWLHYMGKTMKMQFTVQVGKSFKFSGSIAMSVTTVILILALLV